MEASSWYLCHPKSTTSVLTRSGRLMTNCFWIRMAFLWTRLRAPRLAFCLTMKSLRWFPRFKVLPSRLTRRCNSGTSPCTTSGWMRRATLGSLRPTCFAHSALKVSCRSRPSRLVLMTRPCLTSWHTMWSKELLHLLQIKLAIYLLLCCPR